MNTREYQRAYRKANPEKIRAWREANIEKIREKDRIRAKKITDRRRETKRNWTRRNKHKAAAHKILENAVLSGRITRNPCVVCGNARAHGHHEDYSRPLSVIWLCPVHHAARHYSASSPAYIA